MSDKEQTYKDYLKRFKQPTLPAKEDLAGIDNNIPVQEKINNILPNENVINEFYYNRDKYEELFIEQLPMKDFYNPKDRIMIRSCTTDEIQNFSTYDKNNPFSFKHKLNEILEKCILYIKADGSLDSYLNLYDNDRMYLIYAIREKTFPNGTKLFTTVKYKNEKGQIEDINIENCRANIDMYRNESVMKFYNKDKKIFIFETTLRDEPFLIKPPTIGLMQCFDQYIELKAQYNKIDISKDTPFFKIAPYMKPNISYMSYEDLEIYEKWFKSTLKPEEFSFLLDMKDNHLKIGIRGLKKNIQDKTVRTYKILPDRPETIFIIPNAFSLFLKK